jgi:hypothetical protein
MSLNRSEVNPLSALGLRKLSFIPEHFSKITVGLILDIRLLDHWINYNLNSRYAIRETFSVDSANKMDKVIEIGIEDPKELTMLTLGCPHIQK